MEAAIRWASTSPKTLDSIYGFNVEETSYNRILEPSLPDFGGTLDVEGYYFVKDSPLPNSPLEAPPAYVQPEGSYLPNLHKPSVGCWYNLQSGIIITISVAITIALNANRRT